MSSSPVARALPLCIQMLGVKYLKRAIKAEKVLFVQVTEHGSQQLVAQLEIDLNNQQGMLQPHAAIHWILSYWMDGPIGQLFNSRTGQNYIATCFSPVLLFGL